jgi:hypothetical protein
MTMPMSSYREIEAVNFSTLKLIEFSPMKYRHGLENPPPDDLGKMKGRGTHTAVLEPERFLLDYAIYEGEEGKKPIRRGKRWDAFREMHASKTILTPAEYAHCIRAGKSIRDHEPAAEILSSGRPEQVIQWIDEKTGLHCKARLDWITDDLIVDLKGVRSIVLRMLENEIARMRYYCQLAWYREGCRVVFGRDFNCALICAEHGAPHETVVADLADDDLFAGWEMVRGWLDRVAECRASGRWPGRYEERQRVSLPAYVTASDEQEDGTATVIEEGDHDLESAI